MPLLDTLLKEAKIETNTEYGAVNAEDTEENTSSEKTP
jgi:hypothetical protein